MRITCLNAFILNLIFLKTLCQIHFDDDLSYEIYFYSKAAYCDEDNIEKWDCLPCKKHNLTEISVISSKSLET